MNKDRSYNKHGEIERKHDLSTVGKARNVGSVEAMVMEAVMARKDDDDPDNPGANANDKLSLEDLVKPADWPQGKNRATITIDASCTPANIAYPTGLNLLNEANGSTCIDQFLKSTTD